MTVQETYKTCFGKPYIVPVEEHNEAKEVIKKALEEVEQYRALGTVEELKNLKEMNKHCTIEQLTGVECSYNETGCSDCKGKQALLKAMEKQIPKKPERLRGINGEVTICPNCNGTVSGYYHHYYCGSCGQRLYFEDENNSNTRRTE